MWPEWGSLGTRREVCPFVVGQGSFLIPPWEEWALHIRHRIPPALPFLTSIAWCPHRNRLGAPVASLLCLQRDCGFSLWLMSIIYGHYTGGDWLTDGHRLRVCLPSVHQTVSWNALCMSVFSVCSRKRKEKNLPTSSQSSPQPVIPKRFLVQVSTLLNWKLFSVCIDMG